MQATGDLVTVVVELAAGMQHRHHHLGGGDVATLLLAFLGVAPDRDAAAVVPDRDRAVVVDGDLDGVCMARQRLVDAVVHHFEHHVVQAGAIVDVADVHARALADGFQPFQRGDAVGVVGAGTGGRLGGGGFGRLARGVFVVRQGWLRHRRVWLPRRAQRRVETL